MSSNRDPVDDAIGKVGGAVIAGLIGILFAAIMGAIRRKDIEERGFRLPDGLVVDYDDPNYVAPEDRPWYVRERKSLGIVVGLSAGALALCGMMQPGSEALTCFALLVPLFLAAFYVRTETDQYVNKRSQHVPARIRIDADAVRCYTISLPKDTKWQPLDAGRFLGQLLFKFERLAFQISASHDGITWRVIDYHNGAEPSLMQQAIRSFYPDAEISPPTVTKEVRETPFHRRTYAAIQAQDFIRPIGYVSEYKSFDPLANLVHEMDDLKPGERVTYTLAVTDPAHYVYHQAQQALLVEAPTNPFDLSSAAYRMASGDDNLVPLHPDQDMDIYLTKLHNAVYQAVLFVQVDAASEQRARELCSFSSHLAQFDRPMYNQLIFRDQPIAMATGDIRAPERASISEPLSLLSQWLSDADRSWRPHRLLLDTQELAALWHLPHEHFRAENIVWTRGRRAALPKVMRGKEDGVLLGVNRYGGQVNKVYLPDEDRATHLSVIGRTGVGKSTLLHHLIRADIAEGRGVAVIDPKGHLVRDILRASIPAEREDDVVVLDIADFEHPPPFNLLASPGEIEHGSAVGLLLAVFEKLYKDFHGTRMADTFSMALQTLWEADTPTVMDVERLFEEPEYRHRLVDRVDSFVIKNFWRQFESRSQAQRDELAYPVIRHMRIFYGNRYLCPIMCHPQPLNLHQLIADGKIVLVSLNVAEAKIPRSEQNLLGAVLITQIQMAAMDGAIRQPPFTLYIDEAQHFVTTSLPQMLAGARGWGLSVVLANQFLKQLTGEVLDAVLGSVGAVIAFQCGTHDAGTVARTQSGFTSDDLVNLDKYKAGVFMRYHGETQPAFSLETLPPPSADGADDGAGRELALRGRSVLNHTPWTRARIDAWLNERYAAPAHGGVGADGARDPDADFYDPVN